MEYGGCSKFYYGGAGGNRNNFLSKDLCDEVCVEPLGRDACMLPKVCRARAALVVCDDYLLFS